MFSLIKYEWMKRWKFFLAGLVIFLFVNVDLMVRLVNKSAPTKITTIFIGVLFAMGVALFFDHVSRLYRSLFTEEGVFYFSLPITGYHLLGARILGVVAEFVAVSAVALITAVIDYKIMAQIYTELSVKLPENIYIHGLKGFLLGLLMYVTFLLIVYMSMVLAKSIFASIKYGKVLSFICFITISKILAKIGMLLGSVNGRSTVQAGAAGPVEWMLVGLTALILFGITGYLMDRKINI